MFIFFGGVSHFLWEYDEKIGVFFLSFKCVVERDQDKSGSRGELAMLS